MREWHKRRYRSSLAGLLVSMSVIAALGGCDRGVDVTAKPGEAADQRIVESQPAAINVEAAADLTRTGDELAKLLPSELAVINRRLPRPVCQSANAKPVCRDIKLFGRLLRDGPSELTGTARGLELQLPLRYELVAQPIGPGPNTIVNGKLSVTASFAMAMDEHWLPTLKMDPVFKWRDGNKIPVLGTDVSLQSDVEPVLAARLQKLPPAALTGLVPADLRQQVEAVWRYLHYPIALSQDQQIWLRGTPLGLRFAGLATRDGTTQTRMAITVRMQTFSGDRPAPLPPSPVAAPGGGIEPAGGGILLPADVPYGLLTAAANAHLPAIPERTVNGETSAHAPPVKSLAFYAAGKRLGLAVHFAGLPGGSWLSGHAVGYFLTVPRISPGGTLLNLSQTEPYIVGGKSTALQKEMPFLSDTRFAENINSALALDISDKLAVALALVRRQASLSLAPNGQKIYLRPAEARVAEISPGIDALRLQIEVAGDFTVRRDGTAVAAESDAAAKPTP